MEEEDMSDLISNLPYDLLQLIVSLIPFKEAIKTSILSTTWRQIWTPFEMNLEFDSHEITSFGATQKLNQIVGSFINSSYTPHALKLFLIDPGSPFLMATKSLDKELHLEFFSEEMRARRSINLPSMHSIHSHKLIDEFSSLKTLNLKSITHLAENFVSVLCSNCLVLESLKIEKCKGVENINMKANSCLKKFIVVDCPSIVSITICAPNLKSFWYQGVLPKIQFENSPQLVDVVLNLKDGLANIEFDCEDVLSFLASLKDIETLTLSGWLIEWLCTAGVIFGKLDFKLNKLKELCWIDSLINRQKRDSLVCFLQITTSLEKLFVNIDQNYPLVTWPMLHEYWHEPHLWMDYETVKSNNASQLTNLNFIHIVGFKQEEDHLLLMDLLLHRAFALKEMSVVNSLENHHHSHSWCVSKVPKSHLNRISISHPKIMVVSCSTIDCFFLLTQQDKSCGLKGQPVQCTRI